MGIQTKGPGHHQTNYPYVGERYFEGDDVPLRILFVAAGRGWNLETGTHHEHIHEYKYTPITHTVTFDLS